LKAEQFIRIVEINKETTQQMSDDIINWCQSLMDENTSTSIYVSPQIMSQSIFFLFKKHE